jgi:hypothetical protein
VIADVFHFAITGIGFCHAAGRLIIHRGFIAGMNIVMTQKWARSLDQSQARNISALTKDF